MTGLHGQSHSIAVQLHFTKDPTDKSEKCFFVFFYGLHQNRNGGKKLGSVLFGGRKTLPSKIRISFCLFGPVLLQLLLLKETTPDSDSKSPHTYATKCKIGSFFINKRITDFHIYVSFD